MIFNTVLRRGTLVFLFVLAALCVTSRTRADGDGNDAQEVDAQRIVHVLGYVAADYPGAVADGTVTNADEYAEQLSLIDDALKMGAALPDRSIDVVGELRALRSAVEAKRSAQDIERAAEGLRARLIGAFRLAQAPTSRPDAARGRALWDEHCTTCHGATGKADTQRAASLTPRPTNFLGPDVVANLTPYRVVNTVRFGVNGTAMVPFTFLGESDRWDLAYFVTGLAYASTPPAPGAPTYSLAELAVRSDASLRAELRALGVGDERLDGVMADLRLRAPYEDRAATRPLGLARGKLERARVAISRGERMEARGLVVDAYLEGVEPAEVEIRAVDPELARSLEARFMSVRADLGSDKGPAELEASLTALLAEVSRVETRLDADRGRAEGWGIALKSGGILLREGVEAALLVAALLAMAGQAGLGDRRRWIHAGWLTAVLLGVLTWIASSYVLRISGAARETIEGTTALLATALLFYVSWSLTSKREVARWMRFLKGQLSRRRAALSLFGVALLAAYREAFETVLFYHTLLSGTASLGPALAGAAGGAVLLIALVLAYTRAGRFAPPQKFFTVSSWLLYGLAVVFVGQGVGALQTVGVLPLHALSFEAIPALGVHPTVEACAAQLVLVGLAVYAWFANRRGPDDASPAHSPARTAS